MWKERYEIFQKLYDQQSVHDHAYRLLELEGKICHKDFDRSTAWLAQALKESGYSDVERLEHPADGVTSVADAVMPEAWDLTGRSTLKVVSDWDAEERIIADTDETILAAATWCGHTAPEGATGELIRYDAAHPEAAKGKWVFLDGRPSGAVNQPLARAGALGIVSCELSMGEFNPDATRWMNGQGLWGWYYLKEDPRIPIFSITARRAKKLLAKLDAGEKVILHGVLNARTYDGKIYTVTGRIPGESEEELALIAHMYEPFVSDDTFGVAAAIEVGRMLKASGIKLQKSLRVIFVMEHYGTKCYLMNVKHHVKAALNMDGISFLTYKKLHYPLEWRLSALCAPFFGDLVMMRILEACEPGLRVNYKPGNLSDDTLGSDPTIGVPTEWLWMDVEPYHHFSDPIFSEVDWEIGGTMIQLIATYAATLLGATPEEWQKIAPELVRTALVPLASSHADSPFARKVHCDFAVQQLESLERWVPGLKTEAEQCVRYFRKPGAELGIRNPAETAAAKLVATRLTTGTPWSLARIPYAEKRPLSIDRQLFSLMDGKRSFLEIVRMVQATNGTPDPAPEKLERMMDELRYLEKYGYVSLAERELP